ncbi:MAG: hypothetical protein OEN01_14750, partial [Candidatus Krumholzibacteria bacterium]|nr:hypothetical protein [Candidatus Krumholzibacteria bacterium]
GAHVIPVPQQIVDLVLQNGPDAVRLLKDGVGIDRLGYGPLLDPQYYEGVSAPDVPEGSSLGRYPDGADSDDNATDFRRMDPSPGFFNQARRDVALCLDESTKRSRVAAEGVEDVVTLRIVNRGLDEIAPQAVIITFKDSSDSVVRHVDPIGNTQAIATGDSVGVRFVFVLEIGYHHLTITAHLVGDGRSQNNTVELLRRVGDPPILVSEIMSLPAVGCPEYVELFNAGAAVYRVDDHWLRDAAHTPVRIESAQKNIEPGGYLVITRDTSALLGCFSGIGDADAAEVNGAWPSLNHSGSGVADSVVILDRFLLPVERVAYPPQPTETRGRSLERVDLYAGPGSHTWILSTSDEGGSPGRKHERAILDAPRNEVLRVEPNPFDLDRDELFITVSAPREPSRTVVQIFDLSGKRLCDVGSSTELPFVFVWDGRDETGRTVTPGIYVIACQLYGLRTGVLRVEKVVLGCGRRKP